VSCSVFEEVLRQEEDVGWPLGEAAHEVGVPLRAEGDVDADAEALGDEGALEIAADAVEHLELEGGLVTAGLGDEVSHVVDDGVVVGCDAAEDAAGNELAHELDVVGIDVGLGGECEVGGFFVGAFAEADADALTEQAMGVGFRSVEVGLEDCADGTGPGFVEALGDGDGGFGVVGAFHVDADKAVDGGGVFDHLADDAFGEVGTGAVAADVHAHLGEFYADVGVELAGGDFIEEAVVDGCALLGLGDLEDALAE